MSDVDILVLDDTIRKQLLAEINILPEYQEKLVNLATSLQIPTLRLKTRQELQKAYDDLQEYINDLAMQQSYNFYLTESIPIIENYSQILKTPVKANFLGKLPKNDKKKLKLIREYMEIASKYVDIDMTPYSNQDPNKIKCPDCPNTKDFDILENNVYVCTRCYVQHTVQKHSSSYNDIDRVNISAKYMYDRKIHFRDCMNQYQGKQNCTIHPKIYKDLEEQFKLHSLLVGNETLPKHERFKKITKNHILMFLKELGYSKHYENVHLIHYNFTDIKPDDIGYLEEQLLDDFDVLVSLYDKKYKDVIKRKNFINTQHVLYQLLRRHKHQCNREDFVILKTIDRQFFHEDTTGELFKELSWNHVPNIG